MSLPYSARTRPARTRILQSLGLALLLACDTDRSTGPRQPAESQPEAQPTQPTVGTKLFNARARVFDPATTSLVSTSEEQAVGRYRYRIGGSEIPNIVRDDFLVGKADTPFVRLVLSAKRVGDELILETGPAYWHDVIKGGTYGMTIPFDHSTPATSFDGQIAKLILPEVTVASAPVALPTLETSFDRTDICAWAAERLAQPLCGREMDQELGWLTVAGTIDTLLIHGGSFKATGNMDVGFTVEPGGITGGTPPVLAPCNRAAYPGCITTPTGAALIDWLRTYVPSIPEASLPPVRLCIPGLPVRVRAGYWDYSGFLPRWVLPVFEKCRVTSNGELPTIVLPSFSNAAAHIRPHITGSMLVQISGDGRVALEIPIPSLAISKVYAIGNDFKAEAKLGLFIGLQAEVKNAGATFLVSFDQSGVSTQQWTPAGGWEDNWESTKAEKSIQVVAVDRPDSLIFRFYAPIQASAELCLAIVACDVDEPSLVATADSSTGATSGSGPMPTEGVTVTNASPASLFDIGIELGAKVKLYSLYDAIYTREVVHEAEPFMDNSKIAIEGAYALDVGAELKIPATGWILPSVPRKFERHFECCRVSLADLWLQGKLDVRTNTTGSSPDTDGYTVRVERADTLPRIIKAGAQRMGPAFDHGDPLEGTLATTDTMVFARAVPCTVFYSDALVWFTSPAFGMIIAGLRAGGVGVPTYGMALPCDLLVARYTVTLTGVSERCTVAGGPTKEVWLQSKDRLLERSDTAVVTFDIACNSSDPVGSLQITTAASGGPEAGDYELFLDGEPLGVMKASEVRTFSSIRAGVARALTATGGPPNCIAVDPIQVTVAADATTPVTVAPPTCALQDNQPLPGDVTVRSATTGTGTDPDGYQMLLDGVQRAGLQANGAALIQGVPGTTSSVLHLASVAANCRPLTPLPFAFTLNANADPASFDVGLSCTSAPIDSVLGVVEAAAGAVGIRLAGGALLNMTGPLRAELMQLAGTLLRAWGVKTGTSLDVNGYALEPSLLDPRWMGVIVVRGADTWLFGDEAIKVLDASAALKAAAGSLVWIGGPRTGNDVTAKIHGIIRSAP